MSHQDAPQQVAMDAATTKTSTRKRKVSDPNQPKRSTSTAVKSTRAARSHMVVSYEEEDTEESESPQPIKRNKKTNKSRVETTPDTIHDNDNADDDGVSALPASSASSSSSLPPALLKAKSTPLPAKGRSPPDHWQTVYDGIRRMRESGPAQNAPVDHSGCERLAKSTHPPTYRFQTLVSLMLSSQTKDAVTAQAMHNLSNQFADGLTVDNIIASDEPLIDSLICKVGFHGRKAGYIKKTALICKEQYGGDIPPTLEKLIELPGVGPKMAHLTMQVAWKQVVGIGVDTHVHRISNRLGWVHSQTPEQTRMQLQEWLPRHLFGPINALLVGFGQMVCLPIGPKCRLCQVNSLCPEGKKNLRYDKSPNKFHPITPRTQEEEEDMRVEDEANQAMRQAAGKSAAPMPEPIPVTSPYFNTQISTTNTRTQIAPPPPPAAAAASSSSSSSLAPSSGTLVKDEPLGPDEPTVKREPTTAHAASYAAAADPTSHHATTHVKLESHAVGEEIETQPKVKLEPKE